MVALLDPVDPYQIQKELKEEKKILSFRGLDLFALIGDQAPYTLKEVGRIREKEFRKVGAGRNLAADLDEKDFGPYSYRHLVAWDPEAKEVVAAYRYLVCPDLLSGPGFSYLRTAGLFDFKAPLIDHVLPQGIELGRSVVNQEAKKAIMGLFVTWAGLGALLKEYPEIQYFFGNFSLYQSYDQDAQRGILEYLIRHHSPQEGFLEPKKGLAFPNLPPWGTFSIDKKRDQQSYLGASEDLLFLGAALDLDFGRCLECAILVSRQGLSEKTKGRFVDPYISINPLWFKELRKEKQ